MDAFFVPIFVIANVCLLFECFSLIMGDTDFALACRLIVLMLLYLAFVLKQDLVKRTLKKKMPKQVLFHNYVIFLVCTVSGTFHCLLMLSFLPLSWLYSVCVVFSSLVVSFDEYREIEWLKERQSCYTALHKQGDKAGLQLADSELRMSIYYEIYRVLLSFVPQRQSTSSLSPV